MYKFAPRLLLGFSIGLAAFAGAVAISGCHQAPNDAASVPDNSGPDPADANMAPVDNSQPQQAAAPARVLGIRSQAPAPQQNSEQYAPQQAAPPPDQSYPADQSAQDAQDYNQLDADASQPDEYADQPPPELPVYEQPEAPEPNYLWTPGYWGWGTGGYYWIPGAWCAPPYYGALWTPGYWGFYGNRYGFHRGFWGLHIGFYGGINYGFGYTGSGYHGGYWQGNNFYYNRSVNRINVTRITNVYNRTVIVNNNYNRVSYNGGRGGINVRPQAAELAAMRGPRTPPMSTQLQNQREASQNRQQFYNQNKGRPAMVAATRPIAAQPGIQRPNPGETRPGQPGNRPGQPQTRPGQPENRPGQPANRPQVQPTRPGQPENRPGQPQTRPVQPENRPGQPQTRPVQPQVRPTQPQTRPAPQVRPAQPQTRPAPQVRPAQPQTRPAPQQPRPQPQQRPAPQERPAPQPRPQQARPAPAPRPQQQARPAPKQEERPR
jgi:WXXGXW repeat (2 copies)